MSEPNIVLTRIDNRLIHGQIITQWCSSVSADVILVANDDVATSKMRQGLMDMAVPDGVTTCYLSVADAVAKMGEVTEGKRVFLLVETPADALALVKGGLPIKQVNIGNMHFREGKRQVAVTAFVDDADVAVFKELRDLGVELEIRRVPSVPAESLDKLFE